MSRYPSAAGLARWAVQRPTAAFRLARSRPLWAALTALDGLPPRVRRAVLGPVDRVATGFIHRPGDHPVAAPVHVIAVHARGDRARALRDAARYGRTGSRTTTTRLARVSLALEAPLVADELLAPVAALDDDPSAAGLRGEVDIAMGRYHAALDHLERARAARPAAIGVRRLTERARGELALLDPGWRPDLATSTGRHEPQRGRILHLLTNSLPYRQAGYTIRAQEVARCQQAVGLDPRMVTRAGFPGNEGVLGAEDVDIVDGVAYHRIAPMLEPGRPISEIAAGTAAGIAALIERSRPALLHPTTNYVNAQVAIALGEIYRLPVVYEVRGFLEETWLSQMGPRVLDGERYQAAREIETAMMRRAAAIVTVSEAMRTEILDRGGIDPADIVVIPNAVDVDRFTPGPRDLALAGQLGIEPSETVVGYISSLVAYEGIGSLIEATRRLRSRGRRVRLLIVGDGDDRVNLEAAARQAGLAADGTAIFTGRVPHDQVERYHRSIDVFVVPRTNDRVSRLVTPLKPYEAMAMAKAIVVSDVPALAEIVEDGVTGRTFRSEDPEDLAAVLEALLDDRAERARLGEAARAWVVANRTWSGNGARYLELYQRLGVA